VLPRAAIAIPLFSPQISRVRALPLQLAQVADLITAGRRECWGSQISEAKGHRNNAMPFCFCS
jgi:hypothetical protein